MLSHMARLKEGTHKAGLWGKGSVQQLGDKGKGKYMAVPRYPARLTARREQALMEDPTE
jgi:hypothetical protein